MGEADVRKMNYYTASCARDLLWRRRGDGRGETVCYFRTFHII